MVDVGSRGGPEPERFGDYVLDRKIAQGGMAELFLARRRGAEGFEKTLAVKRILGELSANREFVEMFINEAKIAARLSHPNIVQIFDFGKIGEHYFIAMEYVPGENLRTILRAGRERNLPMPRDLAAWIAARACDGLDHAHGKSDDSGRPLGIVHRDVSPQNVLVSVEGEVKVVDFGIAKAMAENPEATRGMLKGKISYLSPEQVTGRPIDARSDVFSAGLVLYELLTGRKLFGQEGASDVLEAIAKVSSDEVGRSIPGLPKHLREVVRRALHADPEKRFGSAAEMEQALDEFVRQEGRGTGPARLARYMRALFDPRIGEATLERYRQEMAGLPEAPRPARVLRTRLAAATGGAVLGLVTVAIVAPGLRPAAPPRVPATSPRSAAPSARQGDVDRALGALEAGHAAEAVAAFEAAFAADASLRRENALAYARALSALGKDLLDSDSDGASERFTTALTVAPDLFEPHFYLAKIHTRRQEPEAAEREYQEALRIDPRSADAHFNLAYLQYSRMRYREALAEYQKALELRPPYLADVYYYMAVCHEQMGEREAAVATLRRGLEKVPDSDLLKQRLRKLAG
jgi:serine/threonine-protein kinase